VYPERLKKCKLTTLHYRKIRGDMIEVYKIVSGKYDSVITPTLIKSDTHRTRGNDLWLQKYDIRVVDHWNSLPNWVVTLPACAIAGSVVRKDRPTSSRLISHPALLLLLYCPVIVLGLTGLQASCWWWTVHITKLHNTSSYWFSSDTVTTQFL